MIEDPRDIWQNQPMEERLNISPEEMRRRAENCGVRCAGRADVIPAALFLAAVAAPGALAE